MERLERLLIMSVVALSSLHSSASDHDLPSAGRSRFDQFIGSEPVPYPFSNLLQRLNAQLEPDAGGLPPLKITLIPLGRSLQRSAAAPDFFHFPRVVVAVDSASKPGFAPLRDRLFIGYQQKSAILEVISYNEAAGRFEFQVVRDYKQGATPSVHYARRALCLACHQNAAPIFARPLWDETPANPAIAAKLASTGRDFYSVKLRGTDIAYFIDAATDRANLFPVWQQIWREGCGAGDAGAHCRRAWFDASLRYALSGVPPRSEPAGFETLRARWGRVWPNGLPIPNPDIPNRDPLAAMHPVGTELPEAPLDHVPAALEPLNSREPLAYWKTLDPQQLIAGLASLFNTADIAALDRALSLAFDKPPLRIALPCQLHAKRERRMRFVCGNGRNHFNGFWDGQAGARGEVGSLQIDGAVGASDIRLHARAPTSAHHISFSLSRASRYARMSDGRRVVAAYFMFGPQPNVTLQIQRDYAALDSMPLKALVGRRTGFDATLWFGHLVQTLAPNAPPLRRLQPRLPPVQVEAATVRTPRPGDSPYNRQCAQCHHTPDSFPPNFLAGDATRRERQLNQCAERIYYRLRMWRDAETQRVKTPMPPPAALRARGMDLHRWRQSAELAALTDDAAMRIRRQGGAPERVLTQDYERLRSCLPPASP